jgi:hypothetical protein
VADQTTSWRPDPFGAHELRFFSADGKPTVIVMDGGKTSYDRPTTTGHAPVLEPPESPEPKPPSTDSVPAPTPEQLVTLIEANEAVTVSTAEASNPVTDDNAGRDTPGEVAQQPIVIPDDESDLGVERRRQEPLSRSLMVAYGIVFVLLAVSALGLLYVHSRHAASSGPTRISHSTRAEKMTTSTPITRTTTTVAVPTALKPGADEAANALISSWATANRATALTVATPAAVTALFAVPYANGLALDRGCSTSFSPIVCTFGPPGGASPNDPIYQIFVSQVLGGWYVSSVKISN